MCDISLLYELMKGNREAFNGVFRYYYPRIMAYTASMVEQKAAEDIVQDVFLYVWENREKLYVCDGFHSCICIVCKIQRNRLNQCGFLRRAVFQFSVMCQDTVDQFIFKYFREIRDL